MGFCGGSNDKESACNAGDPGSIAGLGISPGEENGNSLQFLAWKISQTEGPGGLQPMGLQRVGHDWATNTHTHIHTQPFLCRKAPFKLKTFHRYLHDRNYAWKVQSTFKWISPLLIYRHLRNCMLYSLFMSIMWLTNITWHMDSQTATTPREQMVCNPEIRHMFTEGRPLGDGNISKSMVGLICSTWQQ